jgi:glutamyl-tRNA reductase
MEGVYLYDIDSIRSVAEQSLALRREQVAAAEAIIAEHVTDFVDFISRGFNPTSANSEASVDRRKFSARVGTIGEADSFP